MGRNKIYNDVDIPYLLSTSLTTENISSLLIYRTSHYKVNLLNDINSPYVLVKIFSFLEIYKDGTLIIEQVELPRKDVDFSVNMYMVSGGKWHITIVIDDNFKVDFPVLKKIAKTIEGTLLEFSKVMKIKRVISSNDITEINYLRYKLRSIDKKYINNLIMGIDGGLVIKPEHLEDEIDPNTFILFHIYQSIIISADILNQIITNTLPSFKKGVKIENSDDFSQPTKVVTEKVNFIVPTLTSIHNNKN